MKIKITSLPTNKMATGGNIRPPRNGGYGNQSGWALDIGGRVLDPTKSFHDPFTTNETIKPVDRKDATMEAETGESMTRQNPDGSLSTFDIGGKKHSQGGTPLIGENGDFIFSDFKKLALGGEILSNFGKSPESKKKFTPADLAKQYDLNKLVAITKNPDSDKLAIDTANRMIQERTNKLQELAIVQEAAKGMPNGIPQLMGQNQQGQMQAKYGGFFQKGGEMSVPENSVNSSIYNTINNAWDSPIDQVKIPNAFYNPVADQNKNILKTTDITDQPRTPLSPEQINQPSTPEQSDQNNIINYSNYRRPQISTPDLINTLSNALVPPTKGVPIRSTPRVSIPGYVAPDTRAAIASMQSSANGAMEANAITGDGARVRSSNLGINGNVFNELSKTLGQNALESSRGYNEAAAKAAEAQTKQSFATQEANQLYNKEKDTANFNYEQSIKNYLSTQGKDISQGIKNANQIAWINSMHPNSPYYINSNYGPGYNKNYQPNLAGPGAQSQNSFADYVKHYTTQGVPVDKAYEFAHRDLYADRLRQTTNPWNLKANRTTTTSAPNVQSGDNEYDNYPYQMAAGAGIYGN